MAVALQVIQKAIEPGDIPLRIGPNLNVAIRAFKHRPGQLNIRVDFVDRVCPLDIQSRIVFGQDKLAIRLFPKLDITDRIPMLSI